MVMCIFLFLLWLILNGKVTLEICLFGVVITGAVYAFCVAALGCRPQAERRFLKRLGGYVVYGAILVREIIRANLAVMRVIWSRKPDYHPAIVRVHAPLEKPVSRMLLSNSITLTPGTLTVNIDDATNDLFIHMINVPEGFETRESIEAQEVFGLFDCPAWIRRIAE